MADAMGAGAAPTHEPGRLRDADLYAALQAGWEDFKAVPVYGIVLAGAFTLGGIALYLALAAGGQALWILPLVAGFPLIAPYGAVGLYEASRRRERGEPVGWGAVLGALRGRGDGQLALAAVSVLILFGFWVVLARVIFALFLSRSGIGFDNLGVLWSGPGVLMLLVGTAVGAVVALTLFALTVTSLPMLLDREIDVVTAMSASVEAVNTNRAPMLKWAAIIAVLLFVGMLPLFLGLIVVLPVLGHATWHLYRRTFAAPEDTFADAPSTASGGDSRGAAEDAAPRAAETPETKASSAKAPTPAAPAASDAGPAGGADAQDGQAPVLLSVPRTGGPDDLKKISGVGLKLESVLNGLGIFHYDQIAAWDETEIAWVDERLKFKGRIARDNWVSQARDLARGQTGS